jgi:hypothetical protein
MAQPTLKFVASAVFFERSRDNRPNGDGSSVPGRCPRTQATFDSRAWMDGEARI